MSKKILDDEKDVSLNHIKNNSDVLHACSAEPADYSEISTYSLGSVALTSSDFMVGDGDVSGRKITVASKSITWSGSGNVTHFVVADSGSSAIRGITTCNSTAVTASETKVIAAFDLWEIRDPS